MSSSKIICLAAIAIILVVAFYKCPKKSGFAVLGNPTDLIEARQVQEPASRMPPIMALEGSSFRGGEFHGLVNSVSLPQRKVEEMPNFMAPDEMLPRGNMSQGGVNSDVESENKNHRPVFVNLSKHRLQESLDTAVFNLREYFPPLQDNLLRTQDDYVHPANLLQVQRDAANGYKGHVTFNEGRLELVEV